MPLCQIPLIVECTKKIFSLFNKCIKKVTNAHARKLYVLMPEYNLF